MAGNYDFTLSAKVTDVLTGPIGGSNAASAEIKFQAGKNVTTNPYAGTHALTAGAATITLSTLTAIGGGTLNLTGAVIRGIVVKNPSANTISFASGATNGFPIPSFAIPGTSVGGIYSEAAGGFGTVAAADNTIDMTGTLTQSCQVILITDAAP